MLTSSRGPDANDWTISRTEEEIGRLYEDDTASRPENRWFWSITVMGPARHQVRTDRRAPPTLGRPRLISGPRLDRFKAATALTQTSEKTRLR